MKPDEKWWQALIAKSKNKTETAIVEWKEVHRRHSYDRKVRFECICGKKGLVDVWIFRNQLNGNEVVLGSCCVNRFGIKVPGWRRRIDYLPNALLCARDEREIEFVKSLIHKPVRYGSLIITKKQKKWLEDITRHPFRGKVWPNRKPCPNCGTLMQTETVTFLPKQRVFCDKCGKGCRLRNWVPIGYDRYGGRKFVIAYGKCCSCHK